MKAVLTGHSRGLGAAIGAELLARGIPVLALARRANADLAARFPQLLQQQELDLGDPAALHAWLGSGALAAFLAGERQALLINNAGTVQPVGPAEAQDPLAVAQAVALNVSAPLVLAAAIARVPGEKRVLHVSSGAGRNAYPGWSVYCATKAALDHHARAAALDAGHDLRVCSLAPGVIDTDMQAEIRSTSLDRFPIRERFEALKREGALTSPEDCARRLVDFLLSGKFGEQAVADLRD
ncbi:MAG TPA: SDR family oxidoreductase [Noviherbaspirillum sp.]|jgi:NAD(P)-dependent dehydrogenase (short-subunit alcohol dehydrogenase family)|uniref:SDR family oxidoreductase n=1 Tax=Noviherbaspirillum sp. TaxID=1926288 RepID=UPI002F91C8C9